MSTCLFTIQTFPFSCNPTPHIPILHDVFQDNSLGPKWFDEGVVMRFFILPGPKKVASCCPNTLSMEIIKYLTRFR